MCVYVSWYLFLWCLLTSITSVSHLSSTSALTRLTWTPRLRWIPEHSMQTMIPRLVLAHSGSTKDCCFSTWPIWFTFLVTLCPTISAQIIPRRLSELLQQTTYIIRILWLCRLRCTLQMNHMSPTSFCPVRMYFTPLSFGGVCNERVGALSEFSASWFAVRIASTHSCTSRSFSACSTITLDHQPSINTFSSIHNCSFFSTYRMGDINSKQNRRS